MSRNGTIHLAIGEHGFSACGQGFRRSRLRVEVTCKLCRKRLDPEPARKSPPVFSDAKLGAIQWAIGQILWMPEQRDLYEALMAVKRDVDDYLAP